jgi:hypothetical protein
MNRADFYAVVRGEFGAMKQSQVDGIEAILAAVDGLSTDHKAYLLATAWHETAATMQPIAEYGKGKGRPYGAPGKYGQAQYGRGYVQLTWDANYEKADRALGLNGALLKDFNLAMQPTIAAQILVRGCVEGWFTGKKLSDYTTYRDMRRVVNGTDKADLIARHAGTFRDAIMRGATPVPAPSPAQPAQGFWAALFQALLGIVKGR